MEESKDIINYIAQKRGISTEKLLSTIKPNLKRKNNEILTTKTQQNMAKTTKTNKNTTKTNKNTKKSNRNAKISNKNTKKFNKKKKSNKNKNTTKT